MASSFFEGFLRSQKISALPRINCGWVVPTRSDGRGAGPPPRGLCAAGWISGRASIVMPGFKTAGLATVILTSFHAYPDVAIRPAALVTRRRVDAAKVVGANAKHVGAGLRERDHRRGGAGQFFQARLRRVERDWPWSGVLVPIDVDR